MPRTQNLNTFTHASLLALAKTTLNDKCDFLRHECTKFLLSGDDAAVLSSRWPPAAISSRHKDGGVIEILYQYTHSVFRIILQVPLGGVGLRACLWRSSFATITFQVGSDSSPSQMQDPLPSPHPRSFVSQWQDNLVRRQPNLQQWPINGSFPSGKFAESSQPNLVHAEKKRFRLEKAKKKLAHFDKIPVWVPKKTMQDGMGIIWATFHPADLSCLSEDGEERDPKQILHSVPLRLRGRERLCIGKKENTPPPLNRL